MTSSTAVIDPEVGVPFEPNTPYIDLQLRAEAACRTAEKLAEHGWETPNATKADQDEAAAIATSYAADSVRASKMVTPARVANLSPASLILVGNILTEYKHSVVESSVHIRNMVTNKLILETENPDPRVRLKSLELLGKISDVGLFADKSELTINHQTTDTLRNKLRDKLRKLADRCDHDDTLIEDAVLVEEQGHHNVVATVEKSADNAVLAALGEEGPSVAETFDDDYVNDTVAVD